MIAAKYGLLQVLDDNTSAKKVAGIFVLILGTVTLLNSPIKHQKFYPFHNLIFSISAGTNSQQLLWYFSFQRRKLCPFWGLITLSRGQKVVEL